MTYKVLKSQIDSSVNFIRQYPVGYSESRFVRRRDDYFIIYLSSQTGCNQGCRMCHLTETKQTKLQDIPIEDMKDAAKIVFEYYDKESSAPWPVGNPAKTVHTNWMSRGEPLANIHMLNNNQELFQSIHDMADLRNLYSRFLISTILPKSLNMELAEVFPLIQPDIYYSIYTLKEDFRQKWLPQAKSGFDGLRMLKRWQRFSKKIPKIHFAFIKGMNDSEDEVKHLAQIIKDLDLRVDFNVVRYNPQSPEYQETEEPKIYALTHIFREVLPESKVKIVPRVGFDVQASCGMFYSNGVT